MSKTLKAVFSKGWLETERLHALKALYSLCGADWFVDRLVRVGNRSVYLRSNSGRFNSPIPNEKSIFVPKRHLIIPNWRFQTKKIFVLISTFSSSFIQLFMLILIKYNIKTTFILNLLAKKQHLFHNLSHNNRIYPNPLVPWPVSKIVKEKHGSHYTLLGFETGFSMICWLVCWS